MQKYIPGWITTAAFLLAGLIPSTTLNQIVPAAGYLDQAAPPGYAAQISTVSGRIPIATQDADWENSVRVAACGGGQFLAVYGRNNEIYGQRLTSSGVLLGSAFNITAGDPAQPAAIYPDVACDWGLGRFIVVWQNYAGPTSLYNIHAQAVHGSHQSAGSQLVGSMTYLAASNNDETLPSIACNPEDHTCLVAYDHSGSGAGDIRGILLGVGVTDLSILVNNMTIGDYPVTETKADIAWGRAGSNYLVTWQYQYDGTPDQQLIMYAAVCDTSCGADPILVGPAYLIGYSGYPKDQTDPSAAYNPRDDNFLVSFTYATSYGNTDVWAKYIHGNGTADSGLRFVIADSSEPEADSSIAWSGGTEALVDGGGADQFVIAYVLNSGSRYDAVLQAVTGSHTAPSLSSDPLVLDTHWASSGSSLEAPDVTGSSDIGRYLAAWYIHHFNFYEPIQDYDVYGRLVAPFAIFQPLIRKP